MKNEIIKRNIFITVLASLLFLVLSLFIMSYSTYNTLKEELVNFSDLVCSNIDDDNSLRERIEEITNNQNWLSIDASDNDGIIYISSDDSSVGYAYFKYLSEEELSIIDNVKSIDRLYTNGNTIYYLKRISENTIIRTSTVYSTNLTYILSGIFIMLIILILEIYLSYIFSKKTSNNVINTISDISSNLKNINSCSNVKEMESKYEEVEPILEEINSINNKLANQFNLITNERNKLESVVNKLDEGIIVVCENSEVMLINTSAKKILSINDITLPTTFNKLINDEIVKEKISDSIKLKNNYFFDFKNDAQNKVYFVSISYTKMNWLNIDNERVCLVTLRDVTEDRYLSNIKSNFISNASHELKTPITSIIGFSELTLNSKDKLDEKTIKYIDRINSESHRMKSLIEDLIYLSNLEYKKDSKEDLEKIYIKDEVVNIVETLKQNNKLHLNYYIDCDDCYVYSTLIDISRLLSNLIENASKYNKDGGSVTIRLKEHTNFIILEVIDTGIGIKEEDLSRIYERFYRVDKSRNGLTGGTGLGLNIVKEICDNMNAKIKVESTFGKGTTFRITFNKEE